MVTRRLVVLDWIDYCLSLLILLFFTKELSFLQDHQSSILTSEVEDPYFWLEDPDSKETQEWVENQISLTTKYFDKFQWKDQIKKRMTELYDYPKYGCPHREGDRYFFSKNDGLQNQYVTYQQKDLTSEAEVFFDPNTLSEDGTISLRASSFSKSGEFWAYGLSQSGSDWSHYQIRTVDPNHPMADKVGEKLEWIKFGGISWTHDNKGFFYSRYPAQKEEDKGTGTESLSNHSCYYHRIGTPQSEDKLIFATPDHPKWNMGGYVSNDGQYLIISIHESTDPVNLLYWASLKDFDPESLGDSGISVTKLVDTFEAEFEEITNEGSLFYFKTNLDAPLYKIICIDFENPARENWRDVIPQSSKDVLSYVQCVNNDNLLVCWIRDVVDILELYNLQGKLLRQFEMPGLGSVASISAKHDHKEFFYSFTSFLAPSTIYHYQFTEDGEGKLSTFREATFKNFDPNDYVTEQVFYPSKDGTKIPMFIVHKKSLVRDGNNPTYLYGYGGFNISIQPYFSAIRLAWLSNFNGIYAVANIRGGGEYGEEWHKAGTKEKKQNVFDDFHAAAEYLVENNYTNPKRISIHGGSNGGLLVAACVNQRPELYGVGVAAVGVMDMLKFHTYTIGHFWTADYGCSDNPEDFEYLIKYSPVHNVKAGTPYPSVLLTTADHDDRVSPLHSYKLIASLQNTLGKEEYQKNPLLIRIEKKAGHGAGTPTSKIIEEHSDVYAFVAHEMGLEWSD
eukprot:TRINITY_DN2006_c0_g1_i1.p1 TRINITY_DN2006_c0_g1~~TRINITY_DN2006_c0_g1_i1.p1  ORF type:complete len:733 (-),score=177.81 TRINITY_DN2006_c0_g1_i1:54-2252(-)